MKTFNVHDNCCRNTLIGIDFELLFCCLVKKQYILNNFVLMNTFVFDFNSDYIGSSQISEVVQYATVISILLRRQNKKNMVVVGCIWVKRPFETVFQSIAGRLLERGRKKCERI